MTQPSLTSSSSNTILVPVCIEMAEEQEDEEGMRDEEGALKTDVLLSPKVDKHPKPAL